MIKHLLAPFLLILLAGCGSLPNARPFADATSTLSVSVRTSGQALTDSLREAGSLLPQDRGAYERNIRDFEAAWDYRIKATQGAVVYSKAIADVIAAAGDARETINRVGDSLGALAGAAGIAIPAAPAIGVAKDIGEFLAAQIAIVRTSRKLEEAVAQAQPAVDQITEHLIKESNGKLRPILDGVHKNILSAINESYDADDNFDKSLAKGLTEARTAALKGLNNAPADLKGVPSLQEFDRMRAAVSVRLKERDQKLDQAALNYKARLQLINSLSTAALAWAAAHRDLAAAIVEKRKVDATELQETIVEVRELIKKVRAL